MHSLLDDDLIGIRTPSGPATVSLPELLARLSNGDVDGYTGLRAHQADPWHVFVVSLAASIQARKPTAELPRERAYWRAGLLDLADGQDSGWHLLVDDIAKPAFLQHPVPEGLDKYKLKATTPDELDVLVTAKDHDIKMARANAASAQTWLFALLTYQTTSGFLGAGNFGTLRMNGGFASRPVVSMVSDPHVSRRFVEEVRCLSDIRSKVVAKHGYRSRGIVLTWIAPWNRSSHQFLMSDVEPWAIEAARAVRLRPAAQGFLAYGSTSEARQIGPKSIDGGDVGDPWIPVNLEDKKKGRSALTVSTNGWHPRLLTKILFEDGFELTQLQTPRNGKGDMWFIGSTLVRGQGTTEGFHRFILPVPANVRPRLLQRETAVQLGKLAQSLLADANTTEKALYVALMSLVEGGPESVDMKNDTVDRWIKSVRADLMRGWEDDYFPTLWKLAEAAAPAATEIIAEWRARLVAQAREALILAEQRLPVPSTRRYRARVRADSALNGSLWKAGLLTTNEPKNTEVAP